MILLVCSRQGFTAFGICQKSVAFWIGVHVSVVSFLLVIRPKLTKAVWIRNLLTRDPGNGPYYHRLSVCRQTQVISSASVAALDADLRPTFVRSELHPYSAEQVSRPNEVVDCFCSSPRARNTRCPIRKCYSPKSSSTAGNYTP